jgi:hypothetical protein
MPTQATIQRIAKLLARATSPEVGEAQAALEGAFKRMKRDGVSFDDLLTLPKDDLYQDIMVKLIDLILADQPNLSHASRREAYGQYMLLIVAKFSGGWDGQRSGQGRGAQDEEREAAAREYERRRKAEEESRRQSHGRGQRSEHQQNQASGDRGFKGSSPQTPKEETTWKWNWQGKGFSFSPAVFMDAMQPVWGRGSILWHTLHDPARGFRLFAASLLWGMGFGVVLIVLAALGHAVTETNPIWDVSLKNLFAGLTAVGTLWKMFGFWQSGWFR